MLPEPTARLRFRAMAMTDLDDIGYHVLPTMRRRGYATEAARAVRDCAAADGVEHLDALVFGMGLAATS